MMRKAGGHKKTRVRGEGIASRGTSRPRKRFERQVYEAIDLVLAPFVAEMTPRRYVDLMTTANAVIGRALKEAIRDELYQQQNARSAAES
ncbi:hypothetical protein CIC12_12930 [Burkholderia sp. SG-MS1]|nr:hypothetical protein [Paraburkholderia sp. SG-MS1]